MKTFSTPHTSGKIIQITLHIIQEQWLEDTKNYINTHNACNKILWKRASERETALLAKKSTQSNIYYNTDVFTTNNHTIAKQATTKKKQHKTYKTL